MLIQSMGHGANGIIMRQVQWPCAIALVLPVRPGAVQGVLQDRQLVRVVAHVVDQTRQQHGRDLRPAHPNGAADGGPAFVAGQPRDQVLAGVDGLGQAGELGAVTQEVRAHRQDDVDRAGRLLPDLQQ